MMPSSTAPTSDQAAFTQMMQKICDVQTEIGKDDSDEWSTLAGICQSAKSIHDYATNASSTLWAGNEDWFSWSTVISAAAAAAAPGVADHDALITVLSAFTQITDPSHNTDQWAELHDFAGDLINQLDLDSFPQSDD